MAMATIVAGGALGTHGEGFNPLDTLPHVRPVTQLPHHGPDSRPRPSHKYYSKVINGETFSGDGYSKRYYGPDYGPGWGCHHLDSESDLSHPSEDLSTEGLG